VSQLRVVLSHAPRGIIPKTPESDDDCLMVDETTKVSVDGVDLALEGSGGLTNGQQVSGITLPGHCAPGQFASPPGHVFAARDQSRVVVSHDGWRAVVKIDDLTVPRRVTLEPEGPVRAGDRVSMSWWPSHDRWEGYDASTGVRLWPSEGKPTHLEVPKLEADPPNFSFVVPELEPGDYRVDLALVYLRPEARVRSCRGAHHCSAPVGWHEASPTMTVVE